ncbi:MAG: molybdate ABC transporter substrate-binding protein [Gammaproteobacteria bacterium]|nr:molybdate ABC transporter substrate-binding protein [Gammaproteobacteria bacterium]
MRLLSSAVSAALGFCVLFGASSAAMAASTHVAVAANFTDAASEIAAAFAEASEHEAVLSFGATGQFYTQISQGAPFEVFLAADDQRPTLAVDEKHGVDGTVFTYAIGQLVLYSVEEGKVTGAETLKSGDFTRLAIANPETAPYGQAAVETLTAMGIYDTLKPKLVQGQNIGQAYQFVATGNAEIGFVALGQVSQSEAGSRWVVPQELYQPIRQDAVLLNKGADNPAAVAFLEFLKGDEAGAIIEQYGYALDR